mgnify:CR=1 FL=1|tara:strand:+ start:5103 stop:6362 length:1260 start_codon:yes stop_codon:yes gene_type:complete
MMQLKKVLSPLALTSAIALASTAQAGEVEVLHWWTSGGEAAAANVLKDLLKKEGHTWEDFAVAGGGGESAMTVLKSRAVSGNPPAAAQIKGLDIQEWAQLGLLGNLDPVASEARWDELLPPVVAKVMKYEDHYVGVPVNVHRVNWLWSNPDVFKKAGAEVPKTWDEFFVAADKIQKAGFVPLAHGGQAWQDATIFEAVALGVGGADFFRKAFVDHDEATLKSDTMIKTFEVFRRLNQYIDKNSAGREWNVATNMLINGKAAMQIMGDWAKGELTSAGLTPGVDIVCTATPDTAGAFTFNIDSFVMFELEDKENTKAQHAMARLIMEPKFQTAFNVNKGSIPVRSDVDREPFDRCATDSMDTFAESSQSGKLVPSMAHGLATTSYVQGAIFDVVTNFFNTPSITAEEAVNKLAQAVKAAG